MRPKYMNRVSNQEHLSTYWDSRFTERPDLTGAGHAGHGLQLNRAMYEAKCDVLLDFFREHHIDVRGRRVLDAGCGTGFFSELFLKQGASVTGIDLSEVAIRICGKRLPQARFFVRNLISDEIASLGTFDIICAFDVLIHIVDDVDFSTALSKLLGQGRAESWFMCTDLFTEPPRTSTYTKNRPLRHYLEVLEASGYQVIGLRPVRFLLAKWPAIDKIANAMPAPFRVAEKALLKMNVRRNLGNLRILFAHRDKL